ncbi:hypothetical protein STPYR_11156 [uncultured Stenotrophomonas sp.]|uniref:Uncharacterized protein n=1 Tax=uncultured Stenotrophomonas sp. TaxID=165438 RepID=A0A1Y5Q5R3_9GAMM|nr:hypothetical protein STPYR_11156 [uncultured Stenotrophomonas sp.]
MDAGGQPAGVTLGHLGAAAAIDDQRMRQARGQQVVGERVQVQRLRGGIERGLPVALHAACFQQHVAARGDCAQAQVQPRPRQQLRLGAAQLLQQCRTDVAGADHAHREGLRRQPEPGMRGAQRLGRVLAIDDHRDVALRGTLRDGENVDLRPPQCLEQARRHARLSGHAVAHRRQHADARAELHALHLPGGQLVRERLCHRIACTLGLGLFDHAADRMLGRALRNHHHRHMRVAQRGEHALGGARHTDQPGALDVQHGKIGAEGQPLDRPTPAAGRGDARARVLRLESVADDDRQAALDRRRHGLRVHHLGAEIGQFAGFVVAQGFQLHRLGHHPRVGRQHAVHVGPDVQLVGGEQRGKDGAGKVAAVAAQRGDVALAVAGDEAGDHQPPRRVRLPPQRQRGGAGLPIDIHAEFAVVDHQHVTRVKHVGVLAQRLQMPAQQLRREHLAQPLHAVQHFLRQLADHRQRCEDFRQPLETRIQPFDGAADLFAEQRHRRGAVARAQFMPAFAPRLVATGRQFRQFDQRIGHALHRRHHGDLHGFLARQQQLRHVAVAVGVGHRGTAELVDDGVHGGGFDGEDGNWRHRMNLGWRPRHASGWGFPHPDPGAGPWFSENYAKTTGRTGQVVTVMMVVVIDMQPSAGLPEAGNAWAMVVGDMCMEPRRHQR